MIYLAVNAAYQKYTKNVDDKKSVCYTLNHSETNSTKNRIRPPTCLIIRQKQALSFVYTYLNLFI